MMQVEQQRDISLTLLLFAFVCNGEERRGRCKGLQLSIINRSLMVRCACDTHQIAVKST